MHEQILLIEGFTMVDNGCSTRTGVELGLKTAAQLRDTGAGSVERWVIYLIRYALSDAGRLRNALFDWPGAECRTRVYVPRRAL